MTRRRVAALVAALARSAPTPVHASRASGLYEIGAWDMWDATPLNVLVVRPLLGPGGSGGEITPFNTYPRALEDSIAV